MTPILREALEGDRVTLAECPIGLFLSADDELCLKTEYGDNNGRVDAYIVSSGEFFWGGARTPEAQRAVLVTPTCIGETDLHLSDALKLAISHIEHMASWIAKQNAGYSFEALGEDLANIQVALDAGASPQPSRYLRSLDSETVERWQPIETAPKDGTKILVCKDGEDWIGMAVHVGTDSAKIGVMA